MPDGHPRATDADAIRRAVRAGPVAMPGVHDGLSARLAADAGFGVLFVSGFAVAATRLAAPDLGYVALADMAEVTRWVARVAGGPVVVDADTGYGNAANARHTVETLVAAGAAGVFLEDQEWPKRCGHFAGKRVVAREDWLAKLRAVVDWREETSRDVYLVARTDARAAIGLEEAIARGRAARSLGVDAVFVEAPEHLDEMEAIAAGLPGVTLVANMVEGGRTPLLTPAELARLGFGLGVTPLSGLMAATRAMRRAYGRLADEGTMRGAEDQLIGFHEFEDVTRLDAHRRLERRYGPG